GRASQTYPRTPRPRPVTPAAHAVPGAAPPAQFPMMHAEEGVAAWCVQRFNGRFSASGETYNMYDLTAAHRTLPFGVRVRVHDLENGQSVEVRINDRGPFIEGRIIDLSYAAAQAIQMVGTGTALVRLEILNPGTIPGPAAEPGVYAVQVGAFKDRSNAERLKAR